MCTLVSRCVQCPMVYTCIQMYIVVCNCIQLCTISQSFDRSCYMFAKNIFNFYMWIWYKWLAKIIFLWCLNSTWTEIYDRSCHVFTQNMCNFYMWYKWLATIISLWFDYCTINIAIAINPLTDLVVCLQKMWAIFMIQNKWLGKIIFL